MMEIKRHEQLNWLEHHYERVVAKDIRIRSADLLYQLHCNAGFFPINKDSTRKFHHLMTESMREVDLLGSWVKGENRYENELANASICTLPDLEPYYHDDPWTSALEGKTVLVVHPFVQSIAQQYHTKRTALFRDAKVLPSFELKTIKAVQSIAGTTTQYNTWFDALRSMVEQIRTTTFDIAILGCGAYGFPLAAEIKKMGKKAVHLGGATQILFGIKGARWDDNPVVSKFYNENWIRPSNNEKPANAHKVEHACYW